MSLLKQATTKKEQINKKIAELEFKACNSEEYKVEQFGIMPSILTRQKMFY